MESSEDEEFGWTNTTNGDSDTGPEMHNDEESESGKSFKNKLQKELLFRNGDISEPDETPRKRKKKLKKPKREASSRSRSPSPSPSPRRVKRESLAASDGHDDSAAAERVLNVKVKEERLSFAVPRDSPRQRRASAAAPATHPDPEPEPDPGRPRKKKKKREKENDERESSANETVVPADAPPVSPRKKKTAKERYDAEPSANEVFGLSDVPPTSPHKKKRDDSKSLLTEAEDGTGDVSAENNVNGLSELPSNKQKKFETDDSNGEKYYEGWWKFEAEETVVERRPKEKPERVPPSTKPYPSKEFLPTDDESSDGECPAAAGTPARPRARPAQAARRPHLSERITFEGESESEGARKTSLASSGSPRRARIADRITFEDDSQTGSDAPARTLESPQKALPAIDRPRISDRITFEESQAAESEPERGAARAAGGGLGRFLRAHAHMRPALGALPRAAAVGADDDVWLVRGPRELPAAALRGLALDLAFRSRLKVAGRAYEAAPLAGDARAAVLAPAARGRGLCVRAVPVRGALRLRARPPRPRAPPPAADDEPERVPLPPTRPRHPLLGADYERASLPPDVRRRLAAAATRDAIDEEDRTDGVDGDRVGERTEKKKKKKKKYIRERAESEPGLEPEPQLRPVEKKRKRKHSSRHAPDPPRESERELESPPRKKKAKKEKKRSAGAVAWDSERAIEESLFNY